MPVIRPGLFGPGTLTRGAYAGGASPAIYRVTKLTDSGTGSMRAAVETASGPRVVIFETSGTIPLESDMYINNPSITIAGQTAPDPGITLKNFGLQCYTHDAYISHIRSRPGDGPPMLPQTADHDAALSYGANVYNVVWDHCSFSWAQGKLMTVGSIASGGGVTLWSCLLGEALYHPQNVVVDVGQPSSLALLFNQTYVGVRADVGVFRSVLAHNSDRNPEIQGPTNVWWINNVIYDWGRDYVHPNGLGTSYQWATFLYHGQPHVAVIGNVYISGADPHPFPLYAIGVYNVDTGAQLFASDNVLDQALAAITLKQITGSVDPTVLSSPLSLSGMTILAGAATEAAILPNAGAYPAFRDAVDTRLAAEVAARTGGIISSQTAVGGWPSLAVNTRALTLPANLHSYIGDYTALEVWLHDYADEVETGTPTPPPSGDLYPFRTDLIDDLAQGVH